MIEPANVIEEARRWVGTPFKHQMARLGKGADCVGFIRGVAENLGLVDLSEDQRRDLETYGRTPNPRRMGELIASFLESASVGRKSEAPDGHVVWLQWRDDLPMHLAITATYRERRTLIHALREHGVSEHGFVGAWPARVHSYWRLPNVSY